MTAVCGSMRQWPSAGLDTQSAPEAVQRLPDPVWLHDRQLAINLVAIGARSAWIKGNKQPTSALSHAPCTRPLLPFPRFFIVQILRHSLFNRAKLRIIKLHLMLHKN